MKKNIDISIQEIENGVLVQITSHGSCYPGWRCFFKAIEDVPIQALMVDEWRKSRQEHIMGAGVLTPLKDP